MARLVSGIKLTPTPLALYAIFATFFVVAFRYRAKDRRITDAMTFTALWLAISVAGIELSYVGTTAARPLQDNAYRQIDTMLGFDWLAWAKMAAPYSEMASAIYQSHFFQPLIAVWFLAFTGGNNPRFYFASLIALAVTLVVGAAFPALGPAEGLGIPHEASEIVKRLRAGETQFSYSGVIWFPSFHTALAVLFTWVYWRKWPFLIAAPWNAAMLLTIPFSGNHYLADIMSGAAVAVASIWLTQRITTPASAKSPALVLERPDHREPGFVASSD